MENTAVQRLEVAFLSLSMVIARLFWMEGHAAQKKS